MTDLIINVDALEEANQPFEADLPREFLAKILKGLGQRGLVRSTRGAHGGYQTASVHVSDATPHFEAHAGTAAAVLQSWQAKHPHRRP